MAVGDFNGDGRPDWVVANSLDQTVSVLLNTTAAGAATPAFAAQQTFAAGTAPISVAVADVNGDGRPDLVVANSSDVTVSVLLNTTAAGAATTAFAAQQTFATGAGPYSVAVGDFNGDGNPDLVVTNLDDGTVSVLLNTTAAGATTPSFAHQVTFAVGSTPQHVAAADVNGDGRPDLAVANSGDKTVSVLLDTTAVGAATPAFAAQQTFAAGSAPISVAVGDFSGDGRQDLAVATTGSATVSVLVNTTAAGAGTPSFAAQQTFAVGAGPISIAVGDVNGDGRPDLAVANLDDKTVSVLLNTTAFANSVPVVVGQFGSQGVWEFSRALGTWVQLTAANASLLATDSFGDVAGEFPGAGVWLFNPTTGWQQIGGGDATVLAMDAWATSWPSSPATAWASSARPPASGKSAAAMPRRWPWMRWATWSARSPATASGSSARPLASTRSAAATPRPWPWMRWGTSSAASPAPASGSTARPPAGR